MCTPLAILFIRFVLLRHRLRMPSALHAFLALIAFTFRFLVQTQELGIDSGILIVYKRTLKWKGVVFK